ncbi:MULTISPECIES: ATP-grasp domain-containing protein [unclassified Lentimonas]|uniref:ATP-grasp domain-containing protein n=1 Tax=unclassified Lentimonas TaxID=2630993 RepID=UPI001322A5C2|nr:MULTISPECIES: ATP-grasp domain-containing protein [unclassified Lentimonas]CAA6678613.1 Unannotated [Lentimonas sp. CC4]CAA6685845.1 Unannotated [Lentimonas sp. CC6]CAA7076319.1 Unannotated [Lentimonas sp. CC4]CAA7171866.1 Unannotated [Lentimonas sp. CC21]CAA7181573.1 Unannotated [Lentimonas sp. CC8]
MNTESEKQCVLLIYRRYSSSFTAYPWLFARSGRLCVDVLAPKSHMVRHSKWINEHIAIERDDELIPRLLESLAARNYTSVLCVDEPSRTLLLQHRELPELRKFLPFDKDSNLNEVAVNKADFQEWCKALGIDCPRSVYLINASEVQVAAKQFTYPYIIKGALGAGGQAVDRIESEQDLAQVLKAYADRKGWILQDFIEGDVGTTGFVAGDQGLYAVCSVINHVCMKGGLGPSQIGQFWKDDRLCEITQKMTAVGGIRGLTGFDWIMTPCGDYKVIDPHFGRAVPNMVMAHLDGIDFGEAYADFITDQPVDLREGDGSGIYYWLFPQSLLMIFEGKFWRTLRKYPPWRKQVRLFLAGKNEWRLFVAQSLEFLCGHTRVVLGGIRNRFRHSPRCGS